MIYFGLALLLPALWFGSWLLLAPLGFFAGYISRGEGAWKFGLASGLSWSALAFVRDGESGAIISQRLAGMLSLPGSGLLFLVIAILGFVTAYLWFKAGAGSRVLLKK